MSALGLYFGPKVISAVETKGKIMSSNIQILQSAISAGELEEKVPSEVKIVTLLKDEFKKNKIDAKDATLTLPGRDLVIRTFEMPVIPQNELDGAVKFEAKKYIPFKIEDVVFDFQVQYDKISRKNLVLFVGIKKDVLDKYLSIMGQLGIKASAVEYSAFSVLRFITLANIKDKGVISLINIDAKEEDEINFTVLENGFPLFSRDISLSEGQAELASAEAPDYGMIIEKIKTEIRISLDYYHRKFPAKKIEKVLFLSSPECRVDIETFIKDVGIVAQYIDAAKIMGATLAFSLNTLKGYSASIAPTVKSALKINILTALNRSKQKEVARKAGVAAAAVPIKPVQFPYLVVVLGVLICGGVFAFGMKQTQPVKQEIETVVSQRPQVPGVNTNASYGELESLSSSYKIKTDSLDSLIKGQVYLTKLLEAIATVKPEGLWLQNFDFKKAEGGIELNINAMAYLGNSDQEFELVNKFISDLKASPSFTKDFRDVEIVALDRNPYKNVTVTSFRATCYPAKKGRK